MRDYVKYLFAITVVILFYNCDVIFAQTTTIDEVLRNKEKVKVLQGFSEHLTPTLTWVGQHFMTATDPVVVHTQVLSKRMTVVEILNRLHPRQTEISTLPSLFNNSFARGEFSKVYFSKNVANIFFTYDSSGIYLVDFCFDKNTNVWYLNAYPIKDITYIDPGVTLFSIEEH
jgi:hypothetical protein